jgi:hypothetical protein
LPHIVEGHEIETFIEIEEVKLQHATNVADTSTGGIGSSQNNGGAPHQSPLQAPSPAQVTQEHAGLH